MEQAGLQMLHIIDSVIQGAEMTAFMGNKQQSVSCAEPTVDADDSDLLQQEATLAVQDLKCWALVLKRNLQSLRMSEQDETAFDARLVADGTTG
ncbi:hypothetical protein GCM10007901_11860 [Dyella acidisoli]|uniref:Uncharacterized protein n=2 Tax=Dyella acidisoli TaxID=1867834 RepID=A0ABQ5XNY8_9GAMM|nr:hypothetical protein GCM10007901_11860 [Dyella acidisoli]